MIHNSIIFNKQRFRYCDDCNCIMEDIIDGNGIDVFINEKCEKIDIKDCGDIAAMVASNHFRSSYKPNLKLIMANEFEFWKYKNIKYISDNEFRFRLKLDKKQFEAQVNIFYIKIYNLTLFPNLIVLSFADYIALL